MSRFSFWRDCLVALQLVGATTLLAKNLQVFACLWRRCQSPRDDLVHPVASPQIALWPSHRLSELLARSQIAKPPRRFEASLPICECLPAAHSIPHPRYRSTHHLTPHQALLGQVDPLCLEQGHSFVKVDIQHDPPLLPGRVCSPASQTRRGRAHPATSWAKWCHLAAPERSPRSAHRAATQHEQRSQRAEQGAAGPFQFWCSATSPRRRWM
mmetsp:Transcript_18771/g.43618  ORF Transcript_18771/g.43618 Transcript_18771/m.43618 type:complete len:212 (-) Transcript_18771:335-970(-)